MNKSIFEIEYINKCNSVLKEKFSNNIMRIPKIAKVVISGGIARLLKDNKKNQLIIAKEIEKICNQKPIFIKTKKSCDGFNIKKNDINSFKVTLRKKNMYDFLYKLISFVLPRMKNFKLLDERSIDKNGNLNIGITEYTDFFEIDKKNITFSFGCNINIQINRSNPKNSIIMLKELGFFFKE